MTMSRYDGVIQGELVRGHQIASGSNPDSPYPAGSVALQIPFFKQRGLDLTDHVAATLNISVAPSKLIWKAPRFKFEQVAWIEGFSPETFWFAPCEVICDNAKYEGWVYYPHPDTKTQHFHNDALVEVICKRQIPGIDYGAQISLCFSSEYFNFQS